MTTQVQERQPLSIQDHPDHSPTTDQAAAKDQRIRVTDCAGGYLPVPHSLNALARKKLQGSRNTVFWFVWDKTIRHGKQRDFIPVSQFTAALPDSPKTIRRTIDWLKDNDWLIVNEEPAKIQEFVIPDWILEVCASEQEGEKTNSGQNDQSNSGQNDRYHKKGIQKKENPPTPFNTGIYPNVAENENSEEWVG